MVEAVQRVDVLTPGAYYGSLVGSPWVYDHGLAFSEVLCKSLDSLIVRIRRNKAAIVVVDGNVGEGKTTLAVHIADYVNVKYGGGLPIVLDREHVQLAIGGKDFGEKILVCHDQRFIVLIYDEAGDFDKKTTISRFNRNLMRIFEMYRGFKILIVLALPKFYKLENEIFELGVLRMLLHCEDRTEAQGNFRAFDLEQMFYIKHHASKIIVKPKAYDHGQHNIFGHFLDLPPERSRALDAIGIAAKRREVRKTVYDVKDRLTLEQIAKHFGKSPRWVLLKIRELDDVGEVKLFERRKYYERAILKKLEDLELEG